MNRVGVTQVTPFLHYAMFTLYPIGFCFARETLRLKGKQLPPPPFYAVVFACIYLPNTKNITDII
jgi:hypothetical protein